MKNKTETYILVFIIAILSLYIFLREDKNINYKIPNINTVKKDEITKISFDNTVINKTDNTWFLKSGNKVSETKIDGILREISGIKVIDLISEAKELKRFGLDQPKIFEVFKNDEVKLKLLMGSTSSTGNYTYIKFPEDNNVYSIRGDLGALFGDGEEYLRTKVILTIPDVKEITITKGDKTTQLKDDKIKDIMGYLNNLKALSFKELKREEILLTVAITGSQNKSLIIYNKIDGEYPGTSSDVSFPFTVPEWLVTKLSEF